MNRYKLEKYKFQIFLCALLFMSLPVWASQKTKNITDKDINNASNTADWLAYGRTHKEQRFSPLKDINERNVQQLKPAWYVDLPDDVGLVSTPLVVDGIMYMVGTMNKVRAFDARTGEKKWEYDPEVGKAIKGKTRTFWKDNRGLSVYGDKVFAATWDGRLIAINRTTGKRVWETRTFSMDKAYFITGHPKAFKGKVLIGNGGTEFGPKRGYVSAYDTETGKLAWRFHIVPGNPADGFEDKAQEMAAKTWTGKWWEHGGGGNAWHAITYDEELNTLYIGTGNGAPWNAKIRSPEGGDNLFLCSIVALNPDTGEYKWHYQTTPGETWDYNSNMDIVLADVTIKDKPIKAILHAPKNGFFYVIDRKTGKLVSAEPFADVNWATHVDLKTGRPVERKGARYEDGQETIFPSPWGAHTWHAMSYNPLTGLVYLPTQHVQANFSDKGVPKNWKGKQYDLGTAVGFTFERIPNRPFGSLQAWDPVKQKAVWTVNQDFPWGSGTLTTAGNLVFQGDPKGFLTAYNAKTGKKLWEFDAGLGISAPAITYKLDGRQMISVLVGFGGGWSSNLSGAASQLGWAYGEQTRRLITFALDGKVIVPEQNPPRSAKPILDKKFKVDGEKASKGELLYIVKGCLLCHGAGAIASSMAPDLRESTTAISGNDDVFKSVVHDGALMDKGMPQFLSLKKEELENLRHYIRREAHKDLKGK